MKDEIDKSRISKVKVKLTELDHVQPVIYRFCNHDITKTINIEIKTELCNIYIKSKYIRIVKSKKITLIIQKIKEIDTDLQGPHNPTSLSEKNYIALLFNKYTQKSWMLLLKLKNEFFDLFKLWLSQADANEGKVSCLQIDSRGNL